MTKFKLMCQQPVENWIFERFSLDITWPVLAKIPSLLNSQYCQGSLEHTLKISCSFNFFIVYAMKQSFRYVFTAK